MKKKIKRKKIIGKLSKNNKKQEKIIKAIVEFWESKKKEIQGNPVKESQDTEESKYAMFDFALEVGKTEQDSVSEKLEEKIEEFQKLNKKQKKMIKKLKKRILKNEMQIEEEKSVESNSKDWGEIKKFFQRAGEVVLKALPKLLNTAVTLIIGKLCVANRGWSRKGVVT